LATGMFVTFLFINEHCTLTVNEILYVLRLLRFHMFFDKQLSRLPVISWVSHWNASGPETSFERRWRAADARFPVQDRSEKERTPAAPGEVSGKNGGDGHRLVDGTARSAEQ
jgi:hypothetical protein